MNKKPFVVIHDKKNNVILLDNIEKRQLLFFQFNNYKDADDCRKGLMHLCNPMNRVAEENYSLKKLLDDTSVDRLAKENQKLKNEIGQLQAYNSACEDTLLNVEVVLHRLIDKYCSKDVKGDVNICEVLQEFKKEIFPSIQPEIKFPVFEPVGRCRCIPLPVEIKKEKPAEVLKKALEGIK